MIREEREITITFVRDQIFAKIFWWRTIIS